MLRSCCWYCAAVAANLRVTMIFAAKMHELAVAERNDVRAAAIDVAALRYGCGRRNRRK